MLTNQSSSPTQAISWPWTLPVTWHDLGMKQASCRRRVVRASPPRRGRRGTPRFARPCPARACRLGAQSHRGPEVSEVGLQLARLVADDHELARLVSGDQERRPDPRQQFGEARRVDAAQRRKLQRRCPAAAPGRMG